MNLKRFAPITLASLATLGATLGTPTLAAAGMSDGLGSWEGQGTTVALNGGNLGAFTVDLTRRTTGPGQVRTDGRVVLANGQVIVFWQESADTPSGGFRMTTNDGTGGGRCFANGMCQSYVERADGHAFATTIVRDAPDKLRILVTELDKGQAVRFIQQSLTKKP